MIFSLFKKETGKLANVGKLNTSNEQKLTKKEKYILIVIILIFLLVPVLLTWVVTKKMYAQNVTPVVKETIHSVSVEEEINNLIKSIETEQIIISSKIDSLETLSHNRLIRLADQLEKIKTDSNFVNLNKKMNELDNEIKKSNVYVKKVEEIKKVNKEINTLLESYKSELNK